MPPTPRPWIGINADFIPAGKHVRAQARIHAGYIDCILEAGGLPVIIPPFGKEALINAFLDRIDGVMLSGGLDLDPRRQGVMPHPAIQVMSWRREESDRYLIQNAIKRQLPILATGVGMQLLNITFEGTLFQHLPEDMPRAMPHWDATGGPHRHAVLVEPGTRLDEIYGGGEILINSGHHQAVRKVGNGLRVGARAPDGVIEAIETTDPHHFCIGVQWHPESETASALDTQLIESFLQECHRQAQSFRQAA